MASNSFTSVSFFVKLFSLLLTIIHFFSFKINR